MRQHKALCKIKQERQGEPWEVKWGMVGSLPEQWIGQGQGGLLGGGEV